jgi:16S rRNA (cytosine1402-N4)-methyltransferase
MMVAMEERITHYTSSHVSVLRDESIEAISPVDGGVYVDATFGAGGHTRALLEAADCQVIAIDRDPYTETFASKLASEYPNRFRIAQGRFGDIEALLADIGVTQVNGVLFDLGVSSMQLETPRRGFSFSNDGPLDMRMDDSKGQSAADFVNDTKEEELAGVIFKYGGERMSRRIASAIVAARVNGPIKRTSELANIIRSAVGRYNDAIDPSTRTFQAIRIWVNDELGEVHRGLSGAEKILIPGGKLAVISFHSGEDKIVKDFLKERSGRVAETYSRYQPLPEMIEHKPTFKLVSKKAIVPTEEEIKSNPRSRSAKLRVAERTKEVNWSGGSA